MGRCVQLYSLPLLWVALFLFGLIGALFGPIKYGILPDHLKREEWPAGNALVEGATFLAILGGTITAAGPKMLNSISDQVTRRTRILLRREVPIVFQKLVGFGGVAGAAGLVFLKQNLLTL